MHKLAVLLLCMLMYLNYSLGAIPVILDTDMGYDMDDSWALMLLLNSPELNPLLVVSDSLNTVAIATIAGKFLTLLNRTDIPLGIGVQMSTATGCQYPWASDFDLYSYPNLYKDGVQAIIDTVRNSTEVVTIICIAPLPNIAIALERAPDIASKVNIVAMSGSIYRGYCNYSQPQAEYNVYMNISAAQAVYSTHWNAPMDTSPLDTSGLLILDGEYYQTLFAAQSSNFLVQNLLASYKVWLDNGCGSSSCIGKLYWNQTSSTLYDAVATYQAVSNNFMQYQTLNIVVNGSGYTVINSTGQTVTPSVEWLPGGMDGYKQMLVQRLLSWTPPNKK